MARDTPSTARTWPTTRLKNPLRMGKWVVRWRVSSRVAPRPLDAEKSARRAGGVSLRGRGCTGSARKQAERLPESVLNRGGVFWVQRAAAWSQRSAKRQPSG